MLLLLGLTALDLVGPLVSFSMMMGAEVTIGRPLIGTCATRICRCSERLQESPLR